MAGAPAQSPLPHACGTPGPRQRSVALGRDFEDLDRLGDILESHGPERHTAQVGHTSDGGRDTPGTQDLPAARVRRNARSDIERGPEVAPILLHRGADIDSDSDAEKERLVIHRILETKRRRRRIARIVADDENLVSHALGQAHAWAERI